MQRLRTWTGDVDDFGTPSIAAQVPIIDDQGELVGISMVAEEYPTWRERARSVVPDLLTFAGFALGLGVAGSFLLSRLIRRRTRGLEPAAIAALADQREALLHSIREGVVAVADDGTVTVLSDSARELIGLDGDVEGRRVDDLDLDPAVRDLLSDDAAIRDHVVVLGEPGAGRQPQPGRRGRAPRRVGDDPARPHRAARAAERAQRARVDHEHPARADPRVPQPAAHHLRPACSSGSTTRCRGSSAR